MPHSGAPQFTPNLEAVVEGKPAMSHSHGEVRVSLYQVTCKHTSPCTGRWLAHTSAYFVFAVVAYFSIPVWWECSSGRLAQQGSQTKLTTQSSSNAKFHAPSLFKALFSFAPRGMLHTAGYSCRHIARSVRSGVRPLLHVFAKGTPFPRTRWHRFRTRPGR